MKAKSTTDQDDSSLSLHKASSETYGSEQQCSSPATSPRPSLLESDPRASDVPSEATVSPSSASIRSLLAASRRSSPSMSEAADHASNRQSTPSSPTLRSIANRSNSSPVQLAARTTRESPTSSALREEAPRAYSGDQRLIPSCSIPRSNTNYRNQDGAGSSPVQMEVEPPNSPVANHRPQGRVISVYDDIEERSAEFYALVDEWQANGLHTDLPDFMAYSKLSDEEKFAFFNYAERYERWNVCKLF